MHPMQIIITQLLSFGCNRFFSEDRVGHEFCLSIFSFHIEKQLHRMYYEIY